MTIIAGFQCTDGILMCADTEESMGNETKSQVHKIPVAHITDGKLAIGGAGRASLIEFVNQDLYKYLSHRLISTSDVDTVLNEYAEAVFQKYEKPFAGMYSDPMVGFMIGFVHKKIPRLYKWEDNFVRQIPLYQHESIGIGTLQSNQLLHQLDFAAPYETMLFFAVRMMLRVKQTVQGCGGRTEVLFISSDGEMMIRPGPIVISEIEHLIEMADEVVINQVLSQIADTTSSEEAVRRNLEIQEASILHFKKRYKEVVHVIEKKSLRQLASQKSESEL